MAPPLDVVVVRTSDMTTTLWRHLVDLCSRAYEEDFEPYLRTVTPATHVIGMIDGRPVTHLAWIERELRSPPTGSMRTAYIEAVATLPERQRRGYASDLLARVPGLVAGYALAALSPSYEPFYSRLGWEPWRGPLSYRDPAGTQIMTPDEVVMIHRLPLTPPLLDLGAPLSTDWRPGEVW